MNENEINMEMTNELVDSGNNFTSVFVLAGAVVAFAHAGIALGRKVVDRLRYGNEEVVVYEDEDIEEN